MKYALFLFCTLITQAIFPQVEQYKNNELLVQLQNDVGIQQWLEENEFNTSFEVKQVISERLNIHLLTYPDAVDAKVIARSFIELPGVLVAQVNHTGIETRATPNDQAYSVQWSLNTNQPGVSNAPLAWDITTGGYTNNGDRIVVAVVDDGYFLSHEDLSFYTNPNEIPNNGVDDDNNGYVDDVNGWDATDNNGVHPVEQHGTHVSGIVGAKGNNGIGVTGINWDVDILPITSGAVESEVLIAYGYALEMRALYNETNGSEGAYVVSTNSSFGINYGNPASYPLWCAFYDSLGAYGILSAGATANLNIDVDIFNDIPTTCPSDYMIAVTNTRQNGRRNGGAAYGEVNIDLGAPGTDIFNTYLFNNYGTLTGTSMATPQIAGSIALMHSALCSNLLDEYEGKDDSLALWLKEVLIATVTQEISMQSNTVSGGRLNIYKAVDSLQQFNCIRGDEAVVEDICGTCDGEVSVDLMEGASPFTYEWNTGETDSVLIACAGTYTVTVTDDLGFTKAYTIALGGNQELTAAANMTNPSNGNNGSIVLTTSGGDGGPYNYAWSTGETTSAISNLGVGLYTVTITDNNSCQFEESYQLDPSNITDISLDNRITVFPNPTQGDLNIQTELELTQLALIDISGRTVYQQRALGQGTHQVPVSALSNGIYILTLETENNGLFLTKITVQH